MPTRAETQNQSRGQPGSENNYFLVRPELAGSHRSGRSRLGQTELEVLAVESLNTPPDNRSADCQIAQDKSGLSAGTIETPPEQQVAGQTDHLVGRGAVQLLTQCGERWSGIMPVTGEVDNQERLENIRNATKTTSSDGQVDPEVLVMEPSPTIYSKDHLPRSVEASRGGRYWPKDSGPQSL